MYFFILCLLWCLAVPVSSQFGFSQSSQGTRLLGSSFGVLGHNASFDYVIVGGGTTGLVVASRLASDPRNSVAVIEAGSFYEIGNGNVSQIPAYVSYNGSYATNDIQPLVDWGFLTSPQTGLNERVIHYAQGKCLGGSSARHYLTYQRGTKGCYQKWANMVGDNSYTFENLLPYFEKSVRFTNPGNASISYDPTVFKSSGGPLEVSYPNYALPISPRVQQGMEMLGLKPIPGLNSGILIGYGHSANTVNPVAEVRSSSETSFLQTALLNTSLQVYQQTLAKKVIFDMNKKATAVSANTAGVPYFLEARKEVIVAAGAFHSPQILMVSGIGPRQTLGQYKIPVLSDLQGVGQNMWDQPYFGLTYRVNVTTQSQLQNSMFLSQSTNAFLTNHSGPLTTNGVDIIGWEKLPNASRQALSSQALSDLTQFPVDWPELELLTVAATNAPTNDSANYAFFRIAVVAPISRGNVTIMSTDTNDRPVISPNFLIATTDQEMAVQAFKRARQLAQASGITVGPEFDPGEVVQTDEQILQWLRETAGTIHHASATCAMGKKGDPNAVVDSNGKVFGVSGLRVIDASAFPFTPPGHIQATVYMLAEKLAEQIMTDS